MKFHIPLLSMVLALLGFTSCKQNLPAQTEFVLGTVCTINLFDKGTEAIYTEIFNRLRNLDLVLSANRDDSNIAEINTSAGIAPAIAMPDTMKTLLEALLFSDKSEGAFDPSVGPLVKAWNIGTDYAAVPSKEALALALSLINYQNIIVDTQQNTVFLKEKGMKLDLGGIAKGYAADEVVKIIISHKIKRAIIDLGGNVYAFGEKGIGKTWNIGIRDPETNEGTSILTIPIINKSVVTSGVYERFFIQDGIRYHHILDTKTGYPVNNELLSVTIISTKSILADVLSTTTFVLGLEKGLQFIDQIPETEAVFINKNHEIYATSGIHDLLKVSDPSYTLIH